jgi:hypothetical protein
MEGDFFANQWSHLLSGAAIFNGLEGSKQNGSTQPKIHHKTTSYNLNNQQRGPLSLSTE